MSQQSRSRPRAAVMAVALAVGLVAVGLLGAHMPAQAASAPTAVFQARAIVTGPGAATVDPGTTVSLGYAVNGTQADRPLTLTTDGNVIDAPVLRDGDVVTFDTPTAQAVDGVSWGGMTLSADELTLDASVTDPVRVTVTAHADRADAHFTIHNALTGPMADDVPAATVFDIDYYVNGAAAGTLHITADGAVTDGPTLKHGDVVTLTEPETPTVAGVTFGAVDFSPQTVRLDASSPAAIAVTNHVEQKTGAVQIRSRIDGDGAAAVPGDADLSLYYTIGESPFSSLTLLNPGQVVQFPSLPQDGSKVEFTQVGLQMPVDGVTLSDSNVSPAFFYLTGDPDDMPLVTVTATFARDDATFEIHGDLAGPATTLVPDDTTFTIPYAVNGVPASTPLTVAADGTVTAGPTLKHGDVVTFTETDLPNLDGVQWGAPTFSDRTITLDADHTASVTVTNTADPRPATAAVSVSVTGSGAALVPGSALFVVHYAVNGTPVPDPLTVPGDGTPVAVPSLADGDLVTITSAQPPAVDGLTWATPTLGSGAAAQVGTVSPAEATVTIPAISTATPTPTPTSTPTVTPTPTPTSTPTQTQTPTPAPTATQSATPAPTPTSTTSPTATPAPTTTPTAAAAPAAAPTPTATPAASAEDDGLLPVTGGSPPLPALLVGCLALGAGLVLWRLSTRRRADRR